MVQVPGVAVEAGVEAAVAQLQAPEHELGAVEQVGGQVCAIHPPRHRCIPAGGAARQSHVRAQALVLHVGRLCGGWGGHEAEVTGHSPAQHSQMIACARAQARAGTLRLSVRVSRGDNGSAKFLHGVQGHKYVSVSKLGRVRACPGTVCVTGQSCVRV